MVVVTAVDVDALDKLREAATPGPWGLDFNEWMDGSRVVAMDDDSEDDGITPEIAWNDAALIVAAVNALPDLLAEVRRGRALREAVEKLADGLDATSTKFHVRLVASGETYNEGYGKQIIDALMPVVDRIATARAAAELEAASDIPLKACCPEHASKRLRSRAAALRASNEDGTPC